MNKRIDEIRRAIKVNEDNMARDTSYKGCYEATIRLLRKEEREAIIAGIPTSDIETLCAAWREGRSVVLQCKATIALVSAIQTAINALVLKTNLSTMTQQSYEYMLCGLRDAVGNALTRAEVEAAMQNGGTPNGQGC